MGNATANGNSEINNKRLEEIKAIERKNGGKVHPDDVVDFARKHKDSALHSAFEWDDSAAAQQYRLEQARRLLRVFVEVVPHVATPIRAYVSLIDDRMKAKDGDEDGEQVQNGGYRHMPTLMRTVSGRAAVLKTAMWELKTFEAKYEHLAELSGVFAEIKKVRKQLEG